MTVTHAHSADARLSRDFGSATAFTLQHRPARGQKALGCWLALPKEMAADAVPLVAVHGIRRGARDQARFYGERAAALGRPVIAPLFDTKRWSRYQQVVRRQRADLALLALLRDLQLAGICQSRKFDMAGYSGGAQFVHRFAMLYPHLVSRLTVASAGWYTFPDTAAFPCGLAERPGRPDDWGPRMAAGLDKFLQIPIQVCVGAEDNLQDSNTRSGPEIDAQQGKDRLSRAANWTVALRATARQRRLSPDIQLKVLPDCGHDFRACITRGGLDRLAMPDVENLGGVVFQSRQIDSLAGL